MITRVFLRILVAFAVLVSAPVAVYAQASIAGQVRDTSGAVLPGVTVEAASPALIEKVRSVVTDGTGQYRIENLRPGTYTVTFTLPGFSTVKREGLELTGSFAATVNGDMRVGALEETITVTGETPVVDVQSATRQRVMDAAVTDALPSGRLPKAYAALIPGTTGAIDVGGSSTEGNQGSLSIHGSSGNDMRATINGVNWNTVGSFGSTTPALPNQSAIQEVSIDYAATSAEMGQGGLRINFIPREGGNTFQGTFFASFANDKLAGDNFTQELKNLGLRTPDALRKTYDVNGGYGGPIRRDKAWFYAAVRYNGSGLYAGDSFYNKNANKPDVWTYDPDLSRPASNDSVWKDAQARITWQVSARNKLAFSYDQQYVCRCLATVTATQAAEAARHWYFPLQRGVTAEWSSPLTNRVLLEAVVLTRHERYIMERPRDLSPLMIHVVDQFNGLHYRARDSYANNYTPNFSYRFAASYVTGAHAIKVGVNNVTGLVDTVNYDNQPVSYRVNSQSGVPIPNQITLRSMPFRVINRVDGDAGFFAQDRWAFRRLTATGGVRFDIFRSSFGETTIGPAILTPTRNISFPETSNLGWNDITPKLGASYDLFGTGKTAIKVSLNKYVAGQGATGGLGGAPNPVNTLVTATTRSWNDANRNFVPECVLTNPLANGECGAMADANFGRAVPGTTYDPDILRGWGKRGYNWEFSTGIQHELIPRLSVDVSYYRRAFGNFLVTDNRTVSASDYDTFGITAPADPRLPDGGAYVLTGLYDLNPSKFGLPANNLVTFAKNYGDQVQRWHGVDLTLDARPSPRMFVQGGLSTGQTVTDNCEVAALVPESLGATPLQYCRQNLPFETQFKMLASYTVPRVEVRISSTLQSLPGPLVAANFNLPTAVAAQTLGRPLSGNAANLTVNILEPGAMYGQRLNMVDFRFAKLFTIARVRASFNVDVNNAFNSSAVLTQNNAFGAWLRPTSIITARFAKFSTQIDF